MSSFLLSPPLPFEYLPKPSPSDNRTDIQGLHGQITRGIAGSVIIFLPFLVQLSFPLLTPLLLCKHNTRPLFLKMLLTIHLTALNNHLKTSSKVEICNSRFYNLPSKTIYLPKSSSSSTSPSFNSSSSSS